MAEKTWKLKKGKTWNDKLREEHPNHGKIIKIEKERQQFAGGKTLLIPRPLEIDALIRKTPKGKLLSSIHLRESLARKAGAEACCPMTTGIFARIVAEAAAEMLREGKKRVTPYWRLLGKDGALNPKFPGGVEAQAAHLESEGFEILADRKGMPKKVADYEKALIELT